LSFRVQAGYEVISRRRMIIAMTAKPSGLRRGLTHYGDPDFALYLRRSFARSMGYGEAMLERPVVGICNTASGFNNCHRLLPELIQAVERGAS
jgi:dihydroxy-acid dehydratase